MAFGSGFTASQFDLNAQVQRGQQFDAFNRIAAEGTFETAGRSGFNITEDRFGGISDQQRRSQLFPGPGGGSQQAEGQFQQAMDKLRAGQNLNPQEIATLSRAGIRVEANTEQIQRGRSFRRKGAFQQTVSKFGTDETAGEFNVGLNVQRAGDDPNAVKQTFSEQIQRRQELLGKAQNTFNINLGRAFGDFVEQGQRDEALKGVSFNGLGRLQLNRRLKRQFGPGFNAIPGAAAILAQFDAIAGQKKDVSDINRLVSQGRTALSFLESNLFKDDPRNDLRPQDIGVISTPQQPGFSSR